MLLVISLFISVLANANTTDRVINKLEQLLQCEQLNNCPEDPTNPRNSYYLLGEQINIQLDNIIHLQREVEQNKRFVQLAQQFYQYPNPFVQLKALALISEQDKNIETVNILLKELAKTNDKNLLIQTLEQLKRYPEKSEEIDRTFSKILTTGSFNASKALAKSIGPFLNNNNINNYLELLSKLPEKSNKYNSLKACITHFQTQ